MCVCVCVSVLSGRRNAAFCSESAVPQCVFPLFVSCSESFHRLVTTFDTSVPLLSVVSFSAAMPYTTARENSLTLRYCSCCLSACLLSVAVACCLLPVAVTVLLPLPPPLLLLLLPLPPPLLLLLLLHVDVLLLLLLLLLPSSEWIACPRCGKLLA